MLKLQNVLFPEPDAARQRAMYYRGDQARLAADGAYLVFDRGDGASFDTYFNSFSAGKWRKYTQAGGITLRLTLQGAFTVRLLGIRWEQGAPSMREYAAERFQSDGPAEVSLDFPQDAEALCLAFRLEALAAESRLLGGWYGTELAESALNPVDIAVNICTFRREAFVQRNLEILRRAVLQNPENPLREHLQVYIADNGQTLDAAALSDRQVHVFPNKNVGGAGGFTRGLMEIMGDRAFRATHALFMDDDIVIAPESLYRTYMLLRCARAEYRDAFVGGAMLRIDKPNIQVEAGARWNAGKLISFKADLDLNDLASVVQNEIEEEYEYNAWWYCCIPMSVVSETNLPLPIFIRGDDLEYGLRNMRRLILMNGICVWHEPFENKYSSWLNYYILRNLLYDNALHAPGYGTAQALSTMWKQCLRETLYYRYKNVDLLLNGLSDFLKGVDFLKAADGEALHRAIMKTGYQARPVAELNFDFSRQDYEKNLREALAGPKNRIHLSGLNGLLYPADHDAAVPVAQCQPCNFYRARRVLQYDEAGGKGFITEKSLKETVLCICRLLGMTARVLIHYGAAKRSFRQRAGELTTADFWRGYLGIHGAPRQHTNDGGDASHL